jgi:hypothetical protein
MIKRTVVAGTAAALTIAVAAAAAGSTKTHIYRAFTASGKPAIKVTKTMEGFCNGGSIAIDRNDAWRCFAGNFVLDPCFSSSKAKGIVLCPAAPWKASGIKVRLTGKLRDGNKRKPSTSVLPWGIRTSTGLRCEIATGATLVVHKQRLNYFCLHSKSGLWGSPSRNHQPWTIRIAPASTTTTKLTKTVQIATAWF